MAMKKYSTFPDDSKAVQALEEYRKRLSRVFDIFVYDCAVDRVDCDDCPLGCNTIDFGAIEKGQTGGLEIPVCELLKMISDKFPGVIPQRVTLPTTVTGPASLKRWAKGRATQPTLQTMCPRCHSTDLDFMGEGLDDGVKSYACRTCRTMFLIQPEKYDGVDIPK